MSWNQRSTSLFRGPIPKLCLSAAGDNDFEGSNLARRAQGPIGINVDSYKDYGGQGDRQIQRIAMIA